MCALVTRVPARQRSKARGKRAGFWTDAEGVRLRPFCWKWASAVVLFLFGGGKTIRFPCFFWRKFFRPVVFLEGSYSDSFLEAFPPFLGYNCDLPTGKWPTIYIFHLFKVGQQGPSLSRIFSLHFQLSFRRKASSLITGVPFLSFVPPFLARPMILVLDSTAGYPPAIFSR